MNWRDEISAWTAEAVKEKNQHLQRAERKGRTRFWWGVALAVPLGVIGSFVAWLMGIN